ncbi:MAG: serine kinase [Pseudomonadota bacterium]
MTSVQEPVCLHASAVAINGKGVLILGPSGSGKSALAADLISRGATLISDDQTLVSPAKPPLLSAPDSIKGLIELHGTGLVRLGHTTTAPVCLIVDLEEQTQDRLPVSRSRVLLDHSVRVISAKSLSNLPPIVFLAVTGDWLDPEDHKIE